MSLPTKFYYMWATGRGIHSKMGKMHTSVEELKIQVMNLK